MAAVEKTGQIYRFEQFSLDVDNAELRREGAVVKLAPQPFTILHRLVSTPGRLVTRDELRAELWGDDSVVDYTAGINYCMAQLRAALADSAVAPRFIETVPRRGYKFIAPVTAGRPTTTAAVPSLDARPRATRWMLVAALLLFAATGGSFLAAPAASDRPMSSNLDALKLFNRSAPGLADAGPAELTTRIQRLRDAIQLDPAFADAHALLADALLIAGAYRIQPPAAAYAAAKASATVAVTLAPDRADAHAVLGASLLYADWDWARAERHLQQAVVLDPRSPRAHQWYGRLLSALGRHQPAMRAARRAVELAPASPSAHVDLGTTRFFARRYADAAASCAEALALLDHFVPARSCLKAVAAETERIDWRARYERVAATASPARPY